MCLPRRLHGGGGGASRVELSYSQGGLAVWVACLGSTFVICGVRGSVRSICSPSVSPGPCIFARTFVCTEVIILCHGAGFAPWGFSGVDLHSYNPCIAYDAGANDHIQFEKIPYPPLTESRSVFANPKNIPKE